MAVDCDASSQAMRRFRYKNDEGYREKVKAKVREYYQRNKAKRATYNAEYRKTNWNKIKETMNARERYRLKNDIPFRVRRYMRNRLKEVLKEKKDRQSTVSLIGCSVDFLMSHLSAMFQEGMSWDNYGEWHIDHIKPLSLFDLNDEKQKLEAFHYSNLQPLWASDNLKKGNRYMELYGS